MRVWHNGSDYVVAESEADADDVLNDHLGEPIGHCRRWLPPADAELPMIDDAGAEVTRKTFAEWAAEHGRRYLGSWDF